MEKKKVTVHVKVLLFCLVLLLVVGGVFAVEKDISPELQQKIIDARTTPDLADDGESQSDYALRVLDDQLNYPEFQHNLVDSLVGEDNKEAFEEFLGLGRTEDLWGFEIAGLDNANGDLSIDENGVISLNGDPVIDTETTGVEKYTFRSEGINYPGYLTANLEDGSVVHTRPKSKISNDESGNMIVTTDNDFGITSTAKIEGKGQFLFDDTGGDPQVWSDAGEQASVTVTETDSFGETISEYTIATDPQGPKTSNGLLYASAELGEDNNLKASGLVGIGSGEDTSYYLVKSPKGAVFATGGEALTEGAVAVDRPSVRVGDDGFIRTDLYESGTILSTQEILGKTIIGENWIVALDAEGNPTIKIGTANGVATSVTFDEQGNRQYGFESIETYANRQLASSTSDGRVGGGFGGQSATTDSKSTSVSLAGDGNVKEALSSGCEGGQCTAPSSSPTEGTDPRSTVSLGNKQSDFKTLFGDSTARKIDGTFGSGSIASNTYNRLSDSQKRSVQGLLLVGSSCGRRVCNDYKNQAGNVVNYEGRQVLVVRDSSIPSNSIPQGHRYSGQYPALYPLK